MSISLTALADEPQRRPGDFKRSGSDGNPWVSDPTGATVKSGKRKGEVKWVQYGRPSAFGTRIQNSYNLLKWRERALAWALAHGRSHPELAAAVTELLALERDYDDDTWRAAADKVAAKANEYGKTSLAADRGTHGHAITEDDDEGRDWVARAEAGEALGVPTHVQAAMVQAWRDMLAATGMIVLATELPVVHDDWRLAGTLDRVVLLTRDLTFVTADGEVVTIAAGTVLVLDIKTGKLRASNGVVQFWKAYAVQIAAYNDAVPYDCDTDERRPWSQTLDADNAPFVSGLHNRWAIIAHLPVAEALDGKAVCRLIAVDLDAGRHAAKLVLDAGEWERRTDVFHLAPDHVYEVNVVDPGPVHISEPLAQVVASLAQPDDPFADLPNPTDTPFKARQTPARIEPTAPPADADINGGEGPWATASEVAEARNELFALKHTCRPAFDVLDALYRDAATRHPAKSGINLKVPSFRRVTIARALLELARAWGDDLDDDALRCVGVVIPDAQQLAVPLADAFVALTTRDAERFLAVAKAVASGRATLTVPDDGRLVWTVDNQPAATSAA